MPRRHILTERQRSALFNLPTDEAALLQHYTLADDDLEHIRERRRPSSRLGFAVQLCAFRYPGRLLTSGETIPLQMTKFIAAQLGVLPDDLAGYAETEVTRRRHLVALRKIYGYRMFSGRRVHDLKAWLDDEAEAAVSSADLVRQFAKQCRRTQTILPGISRIERLCADALVAAERRIETRITNLDGTPVEDTTYVTDADGSITFGAVFLTRYDDGCWDYKDMEESAGPNESRAPLALIALLSNLKDEDSYAHAWRQRCRDWAAIPDYEEGDKIRLAIHVTLTDGSICQIVTATHYRRGRQKRRCYRIEETGGLVRLSKASLAGSELLSSAKGEASPVLAGQGG